MSNETSPVGNNKEQQRFEIHEGDEVAFLEYRFRKNDIALMHTLVPEALSGRGLASALAQHALEWAKAHDRKVLVYCPFVAAYLKRHPEYNYLVERQYEG